MSASDVPKSTQKLVQPVVAAGLSMIRLEIPPDHPHRKRFPCVFLSFFFCLLFFGGFFVRFETPGQSQLELFLLKNKQQKKRKKETPPNPTSKVCASTESSCPSVAFLIRHTTQATFAQVTLHHRAPVGQELRLSRLAMVLGFSYGFLVWTGACYWHGVVGGVMFNSSSSSSMIIITRRSHKQKPFQLTKKPDGPSKQWREK